MGQMNHYKWQGASLRVPSWQTSPGITSQRFCAMKANGQVSKSIKTPAFVLRAERAMCRAAKNVLTQHHALGLAGIVWQDGKVVEKPV